MSRVSGMVHKFYPAVLIILAASLSAMAQHPAPKPVPASAAAARETPANVSRGPVIGTIDYYGLRKVPLAAIQKALNVREGEVLPFSKGDVEERIDQIPNVVESHLEAVCCLNGKVTLYIGIEEKGAPHFELHDPPDGGAMLPEAIDLAYTRFVNASAEASRAGLTREDLTKGYARSEDLAVRAIQDTFPALVKDNLAQIRAVLRNDDDEAQRAVAAYIIGYAPDPNSVVNDLQYALRDPDPGVRVNAARSLMNFMIGGVKVEPTWFIEMLNSLSWTDRTRALAALQILTDTRDPMVLEQIRMRALPAVEEMARWKTLEHALPAYILLGRIAGIPEQQLKDQWAKGNRDAMIAQAVKTLSK